MVYLLNTYPKITTVSSLCHAGRVKKAVHVDAEDALRGLQQLEEDAAIWSSWGVWSRAALNNYAK